MQQFEAKEKYYLSNTLNCIPVLLQGQSVLIDLRNETSVAGQIDRADGYMNVNLSNAVYIDRDGLQYSFEQFMVRERMIRQIHIPAEIDVEQDVRHWMENGLRRRRPNLDGKKSRKATFKQKRAETRHKEILQEIQKQKAASQTQNN